MPQVFSMPRRPEMQAEVIAASRSSEFRGDPPLVTIRLRYPRMIHDEIMANPFFRSSACTTPRPRLAAMLDDIRSTPFVPWHWSRHPGSHTDTHDTPLVLDEYPRWFGQDDEPCDRDHAWKVAVNTVVEFCEAYIEAGYDSYIPEKMLTTFTWTDMLVTSSEWGKLFDSKWADPAGSADCAGMDPHAIDLVRLIKQALIATSARILHPGDWHLPYTTQSDIQDVLIRPSPQNEEIFDASDLTGAELMRRISVVRCARFAETPSKGPVDYASELCAHDALFVASPSAANHQAML